jgi:hypothetical protein
LLLVVVDLVELTVVVVVEVEQEVLLLVLSQYPQDLLIRFLLEVVDLQQQHLVYRHMLVDRDQVYQDNQVMHLVVVEMEILQTRITLKVDMVVHKEILVVPEITGIIIHIKEAVVVEVEQVEQEVPFLIPALKVAAVLAEAVDLE